MPVVVVVVVVVVVDVVISVPHFPLHVHVTSLDSVSGWPH